ncbi:hypothetical protein CSKR_201181 [Clonorchis sinensis]|uniref:Uncharacterized protein n=1 Tax=Clonorchis sinensis TaxID=79923 RepID=A0A8T1MMS3_CLOSI|nr:hypothetical protein CSKR_201181 [Clonorchis sinensis]
MRTGYSVLISCILTALVNCQLEDEEEQTPKCREEGEPCSWLPTEFCCEGTLCTNNRCTRCQRLQESCINSNECCRGVCKQERCQPFSVLTEKPKSDTANPSGEKVN